MKHVLLPIVALALVLHCCSSEEQIDGLFLPEESVSPVVLLTFPDDGATDVPADARITVLFNTAMDRQKTQDVFRLSSSSRRIEGGFTWEWNRLIFHPRSPLPPGEYTLSLGATAESAAGVDLQDEYTVQFSVGHDSQAPEFISSIPATGETNVAESSDIRLLFSEAVDYGSLADGLHVSPAFPYAISMEKEGAEVILKPANPLPSGTIRISLNPGIKDPSGNPLTNDAIIVFTVGTDFLSPGIVSVHAAEQLLTENLVVSGIQKGAPLRIRFSEPMNRVSVEEAITITPSAALEYSWISDRELHISALPSLKSETPYRLRIASTAEDLAGNGLERSLIFPFITDHPDSLRPRLLDLRQFASSVPSVPCSDNAGRAAPLSVLQPMGLIDTSQWIDTNPEAASRLCVLQFRFQFNRPMDRTSLVNAFSTAVILHPASEFISLQVHDLQMDPFDSSIMVIHLAGSFPPKGIGETPMIRFTIQGGETGAHDIYGNTLTDDIHVYLSY